MDWILSRLKCYLYAKIKPNMLSKWAECTMIMNGCTQAQIECLKPYLDEMNDEWSRFNVKWCMRTKITNTCTINRKCIMIEQKQVEKECNN